jgi:hypothetical protein
MIQLSPAAFETFFEHCSLEFSKESGPDMASIVEIAAEHGITFG